MGGYIGRKKIARRSRRRKLLKTAVVLVILAVLSLYSYKALQYFEAKTTPGSESTAPAASAAPSSGEVMAVLESEQDVYKGDLILVNSKNEFHSAGVDADLTSVYNGKNAYYGVSSSDIKLSKELITPLNDLFAAFHTATGFSNVIVVSGYRTYNYQKDLLDAEIKNRGVVEALKWVALPGFSEHHTGLAFDLGIYNQNGKSEEFSGTSQYEWIAANCQKYGFVVRYASDKSDITGISNEPWHFRYVGLPHSYVMQQKNLSLEEYVAYLKTFRYEGEHLKVHCDTSDYEIWYTKDHMIPVPKNKAYTVSGDNAEGFIVTVKN